MTHYIAVSGLAQATWGVFLGWAMMAFASGVSSLGPLKSAQRVKQTHLDNLFMGALQMGIAAVHPEPPEMAAVLLIFGSWVNAQLFFFQAMLPSITLKRPFARWLALPSGGALTVSYPWLLMTLL